jgi:hypothetical protein
VAAVEPGAVREFPWLGAIAPVGTCIGPAGEVVLVKANGQVLWVSRGGDRGTKSSARGGAA